MGKFYELQCEEFNVGVTGTRSGMTPQQKRVFEEKCYGMHACCDYIYHLHHGGCGGVDLESQEIFEGFLGLYPVDIYPATFTDQRLFHIHKNVTVHEPKPPLERNHDIVDVSEIMYAFPRQITEQYKGSGTWAAIRYARKVGKRLIIIWPDGTVSREN